MSGVIVVLSTLITTLRALKVVAAPAGENNVSKDL